MMIVREVTERYYFAPIQRKFDEAANKSDVTKALGNLSQIMRDSEAEVGSIIQGRVDSGVIRDRSQATKTVAGNAFQGLIAYALARNQEENLLTKDIEITLKPKRHSLISEYATIKVGNEIQKPDIDLLIYHKKEMLVKPVLIFSMKTSLRERAGQTYRWKLLMDIATAKDCQSIKEKYALHYTAHANFKIGLITTNFYKEITNPQQQGMLKFFDFVYIAKPGQWGHNVRNLSEMINDVNNIYS